MPDQQDNTEARSGKSWDPAMGCGFLAVAVFGVCASLLGIRSWSRWTCREYEFVPARAPYAASSLSIGEDGTPVRVTAYYVPREGRFRVVVDHRERDEAQLPGIEVEPEGIVIADSAGHVSRAGRPDAGGRARRRTDYPVDAGELEKPPTFREPSPEYHLVLEVRYELDGSRTVRSEKLYPRRGVREPRTCAGVGEGIFLVAILCLTFASGAIAIPFMSGLLLRWLHGPGAPPPERRAGSSNQEGSC